MRVGGADEATADRVAAAITDWRDADDLRRPQGAEWQDYAAAGSRYRPRNGPFVALGELRAVAGMTPGLHAAVAPLMTLHRSEEHTSELQSLMRISYAVFCLQKKKTKT